METNQYIHKLQADKVLDFSSLPKGEAVLSISEVVKELNNERIDKFKVIMKKLMRILL